MVYYRRIGVHNQVGVFANADYIDRAIAFFFVNDTATATATALEAARSARAILAQHRRSLAALPLVPYRPTPYPPKPGAEQQEVAPRAFGRPVAEPGARARPAYEPRARRRHR